MYEWKNLSVRGLRIVLQLAQQGQCTQVVLQHTMHQGWLYIGINDRRDVRVLIDKSQSGWHTNIVASVVPSGRLPNKPTLYLAPDVHGAPGSTLYAL